MASRLSVLLATILFGCSHGLAPADVTVMDGAADGADGAPDAADAPAPNDASDATPDGSPLPNITGTWGTVATFATHAELASYGFQWGPSDGSFGAIPGSAPGTYNYFGTAGSSTTCAASPSTHGTFTFAGTLDHVTGSNGCHLLFGPGPITPGGWNFAQDYAGGGKMMSFATATGHVWLMPFHGEIHWSNPAGNHLCNNVPCFYSSIGLAVSQDDGATFRIAGEIVQPAAPLSQYMGGGNNMHVGYGSFVIADANGAHLANPPPDPSSAYVYVFLADQWNGAPGACATNTCIAMARAPYTQVVSGALSGDPMQVATTFHKYYAGDANPWSQPATSATPDSTGTAGTFTPLWSDEPAAGVEVIWDASVNAYLAIYQWAGMKVRASTDLIHWTGSIVAPYHETGQQLVYPTFLGETGDPTVGGPAPRVYFSSFPTGTFPNYTMGVFETIPLMVTRAP